MGRVSIGLEVGTRTVRAIALAPPARAERAAGQVARIIATASVQRLTQDGHAKPLPAVLSEVQELLTVRGPTTVHLADAKVLFRYIATMPLTTERTAKVLRLELASHAADDGDLAADAWTLALPGDEAIHGCAIASPTDLCAGMIDLADGGWKRTRLASGPVAAFNATIPTAPARGEALHLLIDLGPTSTALTLFGEDRLLACRTIGMGHEAFTEAVQQDTHRHAAGIGRRPLTPPPSSRRTAPPSPSTSSAELDLEELRFDEVPTVPASPFAEALVLDEHTPPPATRTTETLELDLDLDDAP